MKQKSIIAISFFFLFFFYSETIVSQNNKEIIITKKNAMVYGFADNSLSKKYRIGIIKYFNKAIAKETKNDWIRIKSNTINGWIKQKHSTFIPRSWKKLSINNKYHAYIPKNIQLSVKRKISGDLDKYIITSKSNSVTIIVVEANRSFIDEVNTYENWRMHLSPVNFMISKKFNLNNIPLYFMHTDDTESSAESLNLIIQLSKSNIIVACVVYRKNKLLDYYDLMKILFSLNQSIKSK